MHRDAVGAAALRGRGGLYGVGFVGPACFAQGRDVIDVDVEAHGVLGWTPYATTLRDAAVPRRCLRREIRSADAAAAVSERGTRAVPRGRESQRFGPHGRPLGHRAWPRR